MVIVDAKDLVLTTFSGPKVETILKSPNARFRTEDGNATSDSLNPGNWSRLRNFRQGMGVGCKPKPHSNQSKCQSCL